MGFYELPEWSVKLIIIIILFLLCMIFGVVPLNLSRSSSFEGRVSHTRNLLISLSNCFAGGVFFSTVILDLFPLVKNTINNALISVYIETDFPLGDFIIGIGFIFMLILEHIVHSCCHSNQLSYEAPENVNSNQDELSCNENNHLLSHDNNLDLVTGIEINASERQLQQVGIQQNYSIIMEKNIVENEHVLEKSSSTNDVFFPAPKKHDNSNRVESKSLASIQTLQKVNLRAYVLVFAISLHSLFEGLAVGLLTQTSDVLELFVALVIHKSIIAFSIGVQLVDAKMSSSTVVLCLGIFSSMTPIGIGLGMAVLSSFNSLALRLWFSGVLQGIATGSFLYVTFFEVLPRELSISDEKKLLKILFVILGYVATTGICYYENRFYKLSHDQPLPPTKNPN
ncbi:zinc transporter ZIP1 [Hydra vulgaris]|uniref:Zinc transporter ZIP1 n=1 Tax=Hydra vulgaris TaxID=6087 RepID=A0ABM4DAU2_HYDVU